MRCKYILSNGNRCSRDVMERYGCKDFCWQHAYTYIKGKKCVDRSPRRRQQSPEQQRQVVAPPQLRQASPARRAPSPSRQQVLYQAPVYNPPVYPQQPINIRIEDRRRRSPSPVSRQPSTDYKKIVKEVEAREKKLQQDYEKCMKKSDQLEKKAIKLELELRKMYEEGKAGSKGFDDKEKNLESALKRIDQLTGDMEDLAESFRQTVVAKEQIQDLYAAEVQKNKVIESNVDQALINVREMNRKYFEMEEAKQKAEEERRRMSNEYRAAQRNYVECKVERETAVRRGGDADYYKRKYDECIRRRERVEEKQDRLDETRQNLEKELDKLHRERQANIETIQDLQEEKMNIEEMHEINNQLVEDIEKYIAENNQYKQEIRNLIQENKDEDVNVENLQQRLNNSIEKIRKLSAKYEELRFKCAKLKDKKLRIIPTPSSIPVKSKNRHFNQELKKFKNETKEMKDRYNEATKQLDDKLGNIAVLEKTINEVSGDLENCNNLLNDCNNNIQSLQQQLEYCQNTNTELQNELNQWRVLNPQPNRSPERFRGPQFRDIFNRFENE